MMEQQLYWIYGFNIMVNSALSFFTSILLIEFFVCLFRVKHPRIQVICRIIPFFKICLDFCLYHLPQWALLYGINPILAEKGTRQLSLFLPPFTGIQFSMEDGKTFSLADVIALSIDPIWIQGIVCVAGIGSAIAISLYLKRIFQEKQKISMILATAAPIVIKALNPSLISWTQKRGVSIASSNRILSPCIIGKTILFPTQWFQDLSEQEFEAIIAHEMAHFLWKDCGIRIVCSFLASLFWWIPTKWWQKRIGKMQEQASDAAIHQFGIPGIVLAGAMLKVAQRAREARSQLAFSFIGDSSLLKNRIEIILKQPTLRPLQWQIVQYGLLFCALMSIFFGRLWIF